MKTSKQFEQSLERIKNKKAKAGVIGAGYVGLPLAVALAEAGYETVAIDLDKKKIASINAGESYIGDIEADRLAPLVKKKLLRGSTDFSVLADVDVISICVPTPMTKTKDPDISYIVKSVEGIAPHLKAGALVILESTTYPGTTREAVVPRLEKRSGKAGIDFFVCFSPERVDPGNAKFHIKNTPKVIGGFSAACLELGKTYYGNAMEKVVPVSSCEAAEMVKLLENTFRSVNIGLVNEVAIMSKKLGIDTWEVVSAAATKPFGYMPFYPGPGLGGHCIPIDPHYLAWKMKTLDYNARFIALASEINSDMPRYVTQLVQDALNEHKKSVNGAKVLVLGVAYKKDVGDVRESPALDIIKLLQAKGADVSFNDPYIDDLAHEGLPMKSVDLKKVSSFDCVVVATDHTRYDAKQIVGDAKLIVDTRNFTGRAGLGNSDKVRKL